MEREKTKSEVDKKTTDIIFSKAIKAGKRIYYLDVKKSRNEDLFVAITESKKKIVGFDENAQVSYEKHKIFLYKEDFDKFLEGMEEIISFVKQNNGTETVARAEEKVSALEVQEVVAPVEAPKEKSKGFFGKFKL